MIDHNPQYPELFANSEQTSVIDHNPQYPELGLTVARSRARAWVDPSARAKHGENVLAAFKRLNARKCQKDLGPENPSAPCASRTWHSDGKKILAAVKQQHFAALDGACRASWKSRTDEDVQRMYDAAMAAKRGAYVGV